MSNVRSLRRSLLAVGAALVAIIGVLAVSSPSDAAAPNLVTNPSLETQSGAFPSCFATYGYGTSTLKTTVLKTGAHTGTYAVQEVMSGYASGDWKLMQTQSTACAPKVTAGHTYTAGVYYKSTTAKVTLTAFKFSGGTWSYWTDLKTLATATGYTLASAKTPAVPAGTTQISFGISLFGNGTLTLDDYSLVDNATAPPSSSSSSSSPPPTGTCTGTATQCAKGQWTVLSFPNHVRAIHTVVLSNGKILFMAGSGNDETAFGMHNFTSSVWDPRSNTWTDIATPSDVFCSGHVQLPNGNVLIIGGNKAYPAADGSHGFEGLNSSYIFNIATNSYQQVNNLNTGHWYPSATELGNGNVFSQGGLNENSEGTVTNEEFNPATNTWGGLDDVPQQWSYFGLYPADILTQSGKLFYTGSHVFGVSPRPTPSGATLIDLDANTLTDVPGLQNIDNRDQSAAVLLPPAQNQKVMVLGGGNVDTNVDANRLTDLIDLKAASPSYTHGPLLPQGTTESGAMSGMSMTDSGVHAETGAQGKMYGSAVVLPDRTVFETGGALHNRADPVYEASSYSPTSNTFTPMAADPVERMYHSESVLYQDGTVISVGSNPGDGSFDMRISIYKPPYLFHSGRPTLNAPGTNQWGYGSSQPIVATDGITSAELIKPAAVTHSSDPNQRLVDLPLTRTSAGHYNVAVTGNNNIAPPGWYMLWVTNANGPSTAQWVHIG